MTVQCITEATSITADALLEEAAEEDYCVVPPAAGLVLTILPPSGGTISDVTVDAPGPTVSDPIRQSEGVYYRTITFHTSDIKTSSPYFYTFSITYTDPSEAFAESRPVGTEFPVKMPKIKPATTCPT